MKILITISLLFLSIPLWALETSSFLNIDLWACSELGRLECVQEYTSKGADVFSEDEDGRTALQLAIIHEKFEVFQFLLKQYTSLEQIMNNTFYGNSPLHLATKSGNLKMVQALIKKYPDLKHVLNQNTLWQQTPLHLAVRFGHPEILQFLIKEYPEPKHIMARDENGDTPLHKAATHRDPKIVQLLIKALPKIEHIMAQNKNGRTALHTAILHGNFEVAQLLIDATPRKELIFTTKDEARETPFHTAAISGNIKILQLIIKTLPNENHFLDKNKLNQTPFDMALPFSLPDSIHFNTDSPFKNLALARIIFNLSPLKVRKQQVKACQKNGLVDPKFCNQLAEFIEAPSSLERGYQ